MLNPKLKILFGISKYDFTISYGIFQNGIQYSHAFRMERCGTFKLSLM